MNHQDADDLAQLRRRGAGDRAALDRARGQTPDANGVLLARVPADAVPSPGPIVVMCEPLSSIDAVEKSAGGLTTAFEADVNGLVPIVLLGGTASAGSVLIARPVAGRWVADQGGSGGGSSLCGPVAMAATSLTAVVTHGVSSGRMIGAGLARRCVAKAIDESIVMHRVDLPPFNPTALPGWPGSQYSPIAWPPPAEAGTFVPLVLSEHDALGGTVGDPIYFYGYGSTTGTYFVSAPTQLDRLGLPSECYPPTDCPGFWLPNWITLVACCLPLGGLGLIVVATATEPTFVDGLPQLDLTQTVNFGYQSLNQVYGDGPQIGQVAPCASDGRGTGTGAIPLDWSGFLGRGYRDPVGSPLVLDGGFATGLNGTWVGRHTCNATCVSRWISRIVIGEGGTPPPPPVGNDVIVVVCGCACGDDCCPVEGVTVRFRVGTIDRTGTTDASGRVTFAFADAEVLGQTGNITLDLTPPAELTRFVAVTRTVTGGFGRTITTSLSIASGYVCACCATPLPTTLTAEGGNFTTDLEYEADSDAPGTGGAWFAATSVTPFYPSVCAVDVPVEIYFYPCCDAGVAECAVGAPTFGDLPEGSSKWFVYIVFPIYVEWEGEGDAYLMPGVGPHLYAIGAFVTLDPETCGVLDITFEPGSFFADCDEDTTIDASDLLDTEHPLEFRSTLCVDPGGTHPTTFKFIRMCEFVQEFFPLRVHE